MRYTKYNRGLRTWEVKIHIKDDNSTSPSFYICEEAGTGCITLTGSLINHLAELEELVWKLASIPNCNNCRKKKYCGFAPPWDEIVRFNCLYHEKEEMVRKK